MKERTKTAGTIEEYTSRIVTMAKRVDCDHESPDFPDALLSQLLHEKSSISRSTWFKKKASLMFYFEQQNRVDLVVKLKEMGPDGSQVKSTNTSARKKKSLTEKEEVLIRSELERMGQTPTSWGRQLLAYTECILLTGMRPIELHTAAVFQREVDFVEAGNSITDYSGDWPMLVVRNGKQTNGRSFGENRHLDLSQLNQKQLLYIKIALSYAHQLNSPSDQLADYTSFYHALRQAFSRVISRLFNDRSRFISLYTYRHQCIADMKHDDSYSLLQIAAIVGHGNDLTATEHYGRKRMGRARGEKVKANEVDVAKVKPLIAQKMAKVQSIRAISPR